MVQPSWRRTVARPSLPVSTVKLSPERGTPWIQYESPPTGSGHPSSCSVSARQSLATETWPSAPCRRTEAGSPDSRATVCPSGETSSSWSCSSACCQRKPAVTTASRWRTLIRPATSNAVSAAGSATPGVPRSSAGGAQPARSAPIASQATAAAAPTVARRERPRKPRVTAGSALARQPTNGIEQHRIVRRFLELRLPDFLRVIALALGPEDLAEVRRDFGVRPFGQGAAQEFLRFAQVSETEIRPAH